jgi:DNA polymerase-3 subunit delta'
VGKQRLALWLAQRILCEAPGGEEPCDECRHCRRVLKLEHPDLHWYFPLPRPKGASGDKLAEALEDARRTRLAELREEPLYPSHNEEATAIYLAAARTLRRSAQSPAAEGRGQVYIIADAEALVPQASSPEAANALLKLLEEPPPNTWFVLTSSEPGRLLDTIRSRTIPLHVSPTSEEEAVAFLVQRGTDREDARKAVALAGGSIGSALGFLPAEDGELGPLEQRRREAFHLLRGALSDRPGDGYAVALGFKSSGARALLPLLGALDVWIRDLAAVAAGSEESVVNRDSVDYLRRQVEELSLHPAGVSAALPVVEAARGEARGNVNPQLVMAGLVDHLRSSLLRPLVATR